MAAGNGQREVFKAFLSLVATAILALQAWTLVEIVAMKERAARVETHQDHQRRDLDQLRAQVERLMRR